MIALCVWRFLLSSPRGGSIIYPHPFWLTRATQHRSFETPQQSQLVPCTRHKFNMAALQDCTPIKLVMSQLRLGSFITNSSESYTSVAICDFPAPPANAHWLPGRPSNDLEVRRKRKRWDLMSVDANTCPCFVNQDPNRSYRMLSRCASLARRSSSLARQWKGRLAFGQEVPCAL